MGEWWQFWRRCSESRLCIRQSVFHSMPCWRPAGIMMPVLNIPIWHSFSKTIKTKTTESHYSQKGSDRNRPYADPKVHLPYNHRWDWRHLSHIHTLWSHSTCAGFVCSFGNSPATKFSILLFKLLKHIAFWTDWTGIACLDLSWWPTGQRGRHEFPVKLSAE